MFFLSPEINLFFRNVFYLPKLFVFFGNRQQSNACAGNVRPKSNARAHLYKTEKKT